MAATATAEPGILEQLLIDRVAAQALHEKNKAAKREKDEKNRGIQIQCLDADFASSVENEKTKYRFKISCTVQEYDEKLKRMMPVEKSGEVEAQTEDDAWAIFCDKWKVRVGPRYCNRRIERLSRKRQAQDN